MPPTGWLNDPNGLCQFHGVYHAFFQYSPFNANGGLKMWGHYTSADMITWNYEGVGLFNGLCQFHGVYHAFFQYSPFNANGGLKMWGHYTSADMITWNYEGVGLFPDQPFDCHGVYSGSAFVEDGKLYLYYTGNVKLEDGAFDYIRTGREANTVLVVSEDGKQFGRKQELMRNSDYPNDLTCHVRDPKVWKENGMYYANTVLVVSEDGKQFGRKQELMRNSDYPNDLTCHVRDPKVWKENGMYYMVQGARTQSDEGKVLVFESEDQLHWT